MARALKAAKAPKAPRKKKTKANDLVGAHFVDDEGEIDGPIYTEKLSPEELTAIAIEGMELQGKLDALENEEGVLKEKAKLATKEVRKRIRETKATVSRLAKEYRNGVREVPAQGSLPGTEPKKPSLRVVEEAKEISAWATREGDAPLDPDAPDPISEQEEQTGQEVGADAPEAAPVAADTADEGATDF